MNGCVIVTGGGRGIGRAVCRRFGEAGANVVAASRSEPELAETAAEVERAGGTCLVQNTDVARSEDVEKLVACALERFGRIEVLVNCAGFAAMAPMGEITVEDFERIWKVNVAGVYHACRAVWPGMRAQGSGVIINISSVAAADPYPGFAVYGASKAWVNAWTKGLSREGRPLGIAVFAVAPGAVETRMLRDALPDFPEDQVLDPAEVAELTYSLTQPCWKYASGQVVYTTRS